MKKIFTFLLGLVLSISFVSAQEYWKQYLVDENFDGTVALPTGWTSSIIAGGAVTPGDNIKFSGSGSGNRGGHLMIPISPDSSKIYLDFDLKVVASSISRYNAYLLYFTGSTSGNYGTATAFSDLIAGIYLAGTSGKFHVWNKDIKGPVPEANPDTIVPAFYTGSFGRPAKTAAWCDSINMSTRSEVAFAKSKWYNIVIAMNFATKKVDFTITDKEDPTNTETLTNLDFINPNAVDFKRIGMINTRGNNTFPGVTQPLSDAAAIGNGANADLNANIDNVRIYQNVKSLGLADVTVKYQDISGNDIKASAKYSDQEVGMLFSLKSTDKESIVANGKYYAYNPTATGDASVVVASGGSTIIVKFNEAPLTSGTYVWKGNVSEFFNEQDANFTTNGANQLAYQNGNSVHFSDASAPIKEIELNKEIDMGNGNLEISAPNYVLNGTTGFLTGTGNVDVKASTNLNFINKMTGKLTLHQDTLAIQNVESIRDTLYVMDGSVLDIKTTFNKPIVGNGGKFTIIPTANVDNTNTIKGVNQLNYVLQVKGNPGNSGNFSGMPRMNFNLAPNTKLNVTTALSDTTYFGTTVNYEKNAIHLGDNVCMGYSLTPANPSSTVLIGELSGSASSWLFGGRIRTLFYKIGSLNTDAEFAGNLQAFPVADAWAAMPSMVVEKVGKGTWTLSGNSPNYKGLNPLKVTDGTLKVKGVLGTGIELASVVVADSAKLAGDGGFIGANSVEVNGALEGTLHIGGSLTLTPISTQTTYAATTTINVNGANIDKITVDGDLYYGGTLVVKVNQLPAAGDYQIFQFGNYIESGAWGFDAIQLPSDKWSFNYATGVLTYKGGDTSVGGIDTNKIVDSIEYYDLTGKKITKTYEGFMILKVKYTDGTGTVFKTFKKNETR